MINKMQTDLIKWFDNHQRFLPWRSTKDPYAIWLSEIILQQTRIDQGLEYWEKFLKKFPTVKSLSKAKESEILALWSGLGYYSRARNIYKTAHIVVSKFQSEFPKTSSELLKFPGIGPYTAAAISSICFGEVSPALDGNALRVYSRLFAISSPIEKKTTIKEIWALALPLLSKKRPGDSNQAIMDIGSTICKPRKPNCPACPFKEKCISRKFGNQNDFPVKLKFTKIKEVDKFYVFLSKNDKYGFILRPKTGIWGGLWTPLELNFEDWELAKKNNNIQEFNIKYKKHLLTHRKMNLYFSDWTGELYPKNEEIQWFSNQDLKRLAFPAPILKILSEKSYI